MKKQKGYSALIQNIGEILERGRKSASYAVNNILVRTYWEIGMKIVLFEQCGKEKTEYGSGLFEKIAHDLKVNHGRGFGRSNIIYMRLLYLKYPKSRTLSDQLSWSHYISLLSVDDDLERSFYEKQCLNEGWSVRELERQINSALFYRVALSKDKKGVLQLAKRGQRIEKAEDVVKDPFVLEFLGMRQDYKYSEKQVEQRIIDNMQLFLLELGKGFSFVARQFRITLGNKHFYVDLVFYHRILKCFVLIDLKTKGVNHADIGQMNMYLNYFKKEEGSEGDNDPIGVILSAQKSGVEVEYALGGISNKMFVSKYKLYLPDKKRLEQQVMNAIEE
jgi:predicted nuclease of restriction endonuclease-like (RecB) superfamily